MELIKNIPDGGGLGGGSSNAAAYLNGVCELLSLDMDIKTRTGIMRGSVRTLPFSSIMNL